MPTAGGEAAREMVPSDPWALTKEPNVTQYDRRLGIARLSSPLVGDCGGALVDREVADRNGEGLVQNLAEV